jgi:soluble lytic murein transglycosylase-like protein
LAESGFNPRALSPKGAMGLMQLMPSTAREMGVADPFDPVDNIHGGVAYLGRQLEALNGNIPLALAAYNAGPVRVSMFNRVPPFAETRRYVEDVLNHYYHFKGRNRI